MIVRIKDLKNPKQVTLLESNSPKDPIPQKTPPPNPPKEPIPQREPNPPKEPIPQREPNPPKEPIPQSEPTPPSEPIPGDLKDPPLPKWQFGYMRNKNFFGGNVI